MSVRGTDGIDASIEAGVETFLGMRMGEYWEGEGVWNPMLAAQYAIAHHAMGRPLPERRRAGLLRQLEAMQLADGSGLWGMHRHADGSLFMTSLCYVAARLCGAKATDPLLAGARKFFAQEDVLAIPSWGKVWLSIAGLYEWEGVNAVPPEAWLLPQRVPLHPANYYCHTRLIYMGMAGVRSLRVRAPMTPLTRALRGELYPGRRYSDLDFVGARGKLRARDLWAPPSPILRAMYRAVNLAEKVHSTRLRKHLLKDFVSRIRFELRSTDYTCLSPVNGLLFALVLHTLDPNDLDLAKQLARFGGDVDDDAPVKGWIWEDDAEGLRVAGARSATWDTSFAIQALSEVRHGLQGQHRETLDDALKGALAWLETQQIHEPPHGTVADYKAQDRVDPTGGFCFAGVWHGWPVSDCTAEALLAFLEASTEVYTPKESVIAAGVRFLLQAQNTDGGFGSYENRKVDTGLEWMNPAEMFGDSMTEMSYYECTASNIAALAAVRERFPTMMRAEIDRAIERAATYLRKSQNSDGSWDGAWGVAYLYGTLFGVRGLRAAGASANDPAVQKACAFVASYQREDGAFAESWRSCLEDRYVQGEEAHPTQTAWALLTLLEGDDTFAASRQRAADALVNLQRDGDWGSPMMSGVFFRTALLDYRLYRRFFPLWALGAHARRTNVEVSVGHRPALRA